MTRPLAGQSPRREESGGQWGPGQLKVTAFVLCVKTHEYARASTTTVSNPIAEKRGQKGAIKESLTFWNHLSQNKDWECTHKHRLVCDHCLVCVK